MIEDQSELEAKAILAHKGLTPLQIDGVYMDYKQWFNDLPGNSHFLDGLGRRAELDVNDGVIEALQYMRRLNDKFIPYARAYPNRDKHTVYDR